MKRIIQRLKRMLEPTPRQIRNHIIATVIVALGLTLVPSAAFAVGIAEPPAAVCAAQPTLVDIIVGALTGSPCVTWVDIVQILVIPALPAIVGLINRWTPGNWPSFVKTAALGIITIASQVLPDAVQAANDGTTFDWLRAIMSVGLAWYLAQKTYDKFYTAPLKAEEKVQTVQVVTTSTGKKGAAAPAVVNPDVAPPTTLSTIINGV